MGTGRDGIAALVLVLLEEELVVQELQLVAGKIYGVQRIEELPISMDKIMGVSMVG